MPTDDTRWRSGASKCKSSYAATFFYSTILIAAAYAAETDRVEVADLPVLRMAQDGSGHYNGISCEPIRTALSKIGAAGGTVEMGPGIYLV